MTHPRIIPAEIERYLQTGDTDPFAKAWPEANFVERTQRAQADLTDALLTEVMKRTHGWRPPAALAAINDLSVFTRARVEPMVRGLFPRAEQEAVLALVADSVVFLTPDNIASVLRGTWLHSAWDLANLYLGGAGADLLADHAPSIVGLSQNTTCYVAAAFFDSDDPFDDFVVHEVAHIFHNTKRRQVGLRETARREWLLDINFRQREHFAYACEAYACVLRRASTPAARVALAAELPDSFGTFDDRIQPGDIANLVRAAAERRNGWKAILEACSGRG